MIDVEACRTRDVVTPHSFECTPNLALNARRVVSNEHSNPQPDGSEVVRLSLTLDLTHSSNTPDCGNCLLYTSDAADE